MTRRSFQGHCGWCPAREGPNHGASAPLRVVRGGQNAVGGWIVVLAASVSIAYAMNSALTGSSVNPDGRRAIVTGPAGTQMPLFDLRTPAGDAQAQGPSCTWIGAYCAFPDQ